MHSQVQSTGWPSRSLPALSGCLLGRDREGGREEGERREEGVRRECGERGEGRERREEGEGRRQGEEEGGEKREEGRHDSALGVFSWEGGRQEEGEAAAQ